MPKTENTRKQRAAALLQRVKQGPSFYLRGGVGDLSPAQLDAVEKYVRELYALWSRSWVLTDLCRLIPELRGKLNTLGYYSENKVPDEP